MALAGRNSDQFSLRFPDGMRSLVKEIADQNGRSMNAEIIYQLERAYSEKTKSEALAS